MCDNINNNVIEEESHEPDLGTPEQQEVLRWLITILAESKLDKGVKVNYLRIGRKLIMDKGFLKGDLSQWLCSQAYHLCVVDGEHVLLDGREAFSGLYL